MPSSPSYQNNQNQIPKSQKLKSVSAQFAILLAGILLTLIFILYFISTNLEQLSTQQPRPMQPPHPRPPQQLQPQSTNPIKLSSSSRNNNSNPHLYPKPWRLVDLEMHYLLNSDICRFRLGADPRKREDQKEAPPTPKILLLILVTSHAKNTKLRDRVREAVSAQDLDRLGMRRAFLVGLEHPDPGKTERRSKRPDSVFEFSRLQEEHEAHSDLIMGSFLESYRNLTYKHLMGLDWATRYCAQAHYIVKQDDDIFLDYYQLAQILSLANSPPSSTPKMVTVNPKVSEGIRDILAKMSRAAAALPPNGKFILGKALEKQKVIRERGSKWFVTREEYPKDIYPSFVSGWAYLTTVQVARELVASANNQTKARRRRPYFWIDDVHVTGTLREESNIQIIDLSRLFTQYKGHLLCCLSPAHVQSSVNHEPFWCDFVAGPTMEEEEGEGEGEGEETGQLFDSLHQHARYCYTSQVCVRRREGEELNRTCVVTQESFNFRSKQNKRLNANKKELTQQMKTRRGRGEWRVMSL